MKKLYENVIKLAKSVAMEVVVYTYAVFLVIKGLVTGNWPNLD